MRRSITRTLRRERPTIWRQNYCPTSFSISLWMCTALESSCAKFSTERSPSTCSASTTSSRGYWMGRGRRYQALQQVWSEATMEKSLYLIWFDLICWGFASNYYHRFFRRTSKLSGAMWCSFRSKGGGSSKRNDSCWFPLPTSVRASVHFDDRTPFECIYFMDLLIVLWCMFVSHRFPPSNPYTCHHPLSTPPRVLQAAQKEPSNWFRGTQHITSSFPDFSRLTVSGALFLCSLFP